MSHASKMATAAVAVFGLASGSAMASGSVGGYIAEWGDQGSGIGVEASFLLGENARLFGELISVEDSDINAELDIFKVGGSFVMPMNDQMSLEFGGSFQNWEMSAQTFLGTTSVDDDVIGLHGIMNMGITDAFHFRGSLEYLMFDEMDDETAVIGLRGTYDITSAFSVFAGIDLFTNDDVVDEDLIRLGASFNF